ncbi:MAG: UDP-N-acetylmuramoyl-tripeptide--D-alanyl-D-alanine ligase [Eubacteriales bacterium]|nr:UDP-N-acetylmuramoyl-tripeptide--D-alanyl-D-alanine ligase [Eubacteriales bacterium]
MAILESVMQWIVLLLFLFAAGVVLRYFTHMLQLSSYQFQGYFRFLSSEPVRWLPLIFVFVAAGAVLLDYKKVGFLFGIVYLCALLFYYWPRKVKKKFVATSRAKRLFATMGVLWVLIFAVAYVWAPAEGEILIPAVAFALHPLLLALANLINQPVEKAVRSYYIEDAKRILREHPDLTVIGITGSFGKTSVKYYLTSLLAEGFRVLMTPESYNTPMGIVKTIRGDLQATHQIFVCEMGARHVGDIREICEIVHPDHGLITSIGYQHLETFHSLENIIGTKYELLDEVAHNGRNGYKFVNGDCQVIAENMKYPDAITYGLGETNDYHGVVLEVSKNGTVFAVTNPAGETEEFRMKLLGRHNAENVIGAIAVANTLGIPMRRLKAAVRRLEGVPHRLQLIPKGNVTVIDDAYNANPEGTKAALETLALFQACKILVTPGMVELGERQDEENEKFGRSAAAVCDYIILVGERTTRSIRKGVLEAGFVPEKLIMAQNLAEAVKTMYEIESGREKVILLENDLPDNYT